MRRFTGVLLGTLLVASCRSRPVTSPSGPSGASGASATPTAPTPSPSATRDPIVPPPPRRGPATPARPAVSEVAPNPDREFRGVWVATVANIDWPSSRTLTTEQQQQELRQLLDRAAALRLNAVIFQVRPAADALYQSAIEPWSVYLTGQQGKAPDPFWDPLEFAVREAHQRGMELHAWFNPYRAKQTGNTGPMARTHISRTNPALVKKYGEMLWMDPGEPAVRARTLRVVMDVVKRYDIDGVHIDDYFYPYPETDRRRREIPFPDDVSWRKYRKSGGTLTRDDWRRENVNLLVSALDEQIHKAKPWVKFGISPFGIWRPGFPAQVRGFDSYDKLYADARKWLREGWVDYFSPQLYWPTTKVEQAYPTLLQWWVSENVQSRHMWPGNFTSRAGGTGSGAFSVGELLEQIRVTRDQPGASGNVHFSMKSFLTNQAGMNDTLQRGPYTSVALVPATTWLPQAAPPVPSIAVVDRPGASVIELGTYGKAAPWQWFVQFRTDTGWTSQLLPGSVGTVTLPATGVSKVTVRSINRVGVESPPISVALPESASGTAPRNSSTGRSHVR